MIGNPSCQDPLGNRIAPLKKRKLKHLSSAPSTDTTDKECFWRQYPTHVSMLSSRFQKPRGRTMERRGRPSGLLGGPVIKTLSSNAAGVGSIPGQRAKIPHASWPEKKKKERKKGNRKQQKQYCNKFNTN